MVASQEEILKRIRIPTLRESTQKVIELINDPGVAAIDYAKVIATDPGLSSSVLKLVNSALYSFRRQIAEIKDACVLLGLRNLRSLCLSAALAGEIGEEESERIRACWQYSLATGQVARRIAREVCADAEGEVSTGGLLHAVGIIGLLGSPDFCPQDMLHGAMPPAQSWCELERDELGCDHAQLSAGIAKKWRLPEEVCAVAGDWERRTGEVARPAWCVAVASTVIQKELGDFVHRTDVEGDLQHLAQWAPDPWATVEEILPAALDDARLQVELVRA